MRDGSLIGFATWCYMTFEEAETREYSGREVFSRSGGDQLWVMDMVAVDSVLYIARDMRRFLSDVTDHDVAYWKRPDGRQGNVEIEAWVNPLIAVATTVAQGTVFGSRRRIEAGKTSPTRDWATRMGRVARAVI